MKCSHRDHRQNQRPASFSRRWVCQRAAFVGALALVWGAAAPVSLLQQAAASTCTAGSPELNVSANGFSCPVKLPSSSGLGEPSIIADNGAGNGGVARLFVTAPQGLGNVQAGGSPLFTSTDGGSTWSAPVRSDMCSGLSGGDTALAVDAANNVYQTDLWLGNSCVSVSEDHGSSFTAGDPFGQELQPGDDRPWLAYDSTIANGGELFGTFDGFDGVHVVNTAPLVNPAVGLQAISDNVAIPESIIADSAVPSSSVRTCVCPPGGIAVDNSNGPHRGRVYVAFSDQLGQGVAYADPNAAGTTPTGTWSYSFIRDANSGSAFQDEWNFSPISVGPNGTVYVMWAHALSYSTANSLAGGGGVQEYYAYSTDGGQTFSNPVLLSTEDGTDGSQGTTTFPTMDVVAPGVIDAAWYGTTATGDPNSVPSSAQWNLYYTRVTGANTAAPTVATPVVAISDMHNGCIQTGGGKACTDRSLLDFFTLTDVSGQPNIIYTAGDASSGTHLYFTKLAAAVSPSPSVPEAPLAILLPLVALAVAAGLWLRARRASPSERRG